MGNYRSLLVATLLVAGCTDPAPSNSGTVAPRDDRPGTGTDNTRTAIGTASRKAVADISAATLGVPVYPGAYRLSAEAWKLDDVLEEGAESLTAIVLFSPDLIDQVHGYYQQQLHDGQLEVFQTWVSGGRVISLTIKQTTYATNLLLRESRDPQGTRIEISRTQASTPMPST